MLTEARECGSALGADDIRDEMQPNLPGLPPSNADERDDISRQQPIGSGTQPCRRWRACARLRRRWWRRQCADDRSRSRHRRGFWQCQRFALSALLQRHCALFDRLQDPAVMALAGAQPHRIPRRRIDEHGDALILAGDGADQRQVRMLWYRRRRCWRRPRRRDRHTGDSRCRRTPRQRNSGRVRVAVSALSGIAQSGLAAIVGASAGFAVTSGGGMA
jgi:hypothetical protein